MSLREIRDLESRAVALMGSTASAAQFDSLVTSRRKLILLLDGDDAGQRGQRLLTRQLDRKGHPYRSLNIKKGASQSTVGAVFVRYDALKSNGLRSFTG